MGLYVCLSMKKAPAFAGAVVDDIGIENINLDFERAVCCCEDCFVWWTGAV